MRIYTNEMIKEKNAKRKKIKKAIKIICMPFIILILGLASYIGYFKIIKHESNISLLGYKQYVVMTGSMEPNYNIGDLIIEKEIAKEDIKVGDVITYALENGQDTVTHRVLEIVEQDGQTMYRTKGDNNNAPDPDLVSYNQVQGNIIYKIDKLGATIAEFASGTGAVLLIIIIGINYMHTTKQEEKRIAREDARKRYNVCKYITKREDANDQV